MNYRLQNAEKTSDFTINTHQKCLKFDDKTPKNALKFMQKMRQIFSELSVWRFRPKFYVKKPCVSLFVVGVLSADFAFALNLSYALPEYPITLKNNEQRTDLAIPTPAKPNYEMTTFNCRNDANSGDCYVKRNLNIQGASNATYILQANDTTTTFYAQSISVAQGIKSALMGFHTTYFQQGLTLSDGSSISIFSSGTTIKAQGSELGGLSKVKFGNRNAQVVLGANSSATFTNAHFFISDSKISVNSNANLSIDASKGVRFQNDTTNNGGNITTKGNTYNIGGAINGISNSVATFTQNSGTTTINGNFYNGGQGVVDTTGVVMGWNNFDPDYGGGGNLELNGGTFEVKGQLISQRGGTPMNGGGLYDPKDSTISIRGATLIVSGGLYNKDGSTITFGMGNGTMGLLKGNLNNENGVVRIDMTNAKVGQSYTVLQGKLTGLQDSQVQIINNPNPDFLTAAYQNGNVYLARKGTTPPDPTIPPTPNPKPDPNDEFNKYKNSLLDNEKDIYKALASKFGNDDNELLGQVRHLKTTITETNKAVQDNLVSQPQNMLTAFKGDVLLAPMSQGRFVARRLAASGAVRFDNGKRVRALQAKPNVEFQLAPVGGVMKSADMNGVLAGLSLGTNYKMGAFTHKTSLAYAYGTAKQDLSTQSTETKAHLLQAGVLSLYKYGIYETEMNANLLFGSFTIDNKWTEQSLNSSSKFNNYELNLGLVAGARYGKRLSFKPFVGVQNYGQRQDGFVGILGFESKAYNAYILDGVLGVQMQYVRNAFSSVYGKVSFERRLYNTHKFVFLRSGENELKYENQSYESVVSAALGAQLLTYKRFKLNAEGFLRHYDTGLNYYGGSLVMRYRF